MPTYDDDDDASEELDQSEYPEPDDDEDDDGTAPCAYCGKPRYEECEQCPHCGKYQSREDDPSRPPLWVILGVLACLGIALLWVLGR